MQELLLSDEFRRYRKHLVELIVKEIDLKDAEQDLVEMRGKLKLARKVLGLPSELLSGKHQEIARAQFVEDFKEVQARFVRAYVEEE